LPRKILIVNTYIRYKKDIYSSSLLGAIRKGYWGVIPFHFKVDTNGQQGKQGKQGRQGGRGRGGKRICIMNFVKWYQKPELVDNFIF
jgi:hypothetical protein